MAAALGNHRWWTLLALLVACGGAERTVTVQVLAGETAPELLIVTWFRPDGLRLSDRRVPERGTLPADRQVLATIRTTVDESDLRPRKILVRGLRGENQVAIGAARIDIDSPQPIAVTLTGGLPDQDGDGLPDGIDDDCPCAPVADAGVPADASALVDGAAADSGAAETPPDTGPSDTGPPDTAADQALPDLMGPAVQRTGLVALWAFDDAIGTSVTDSSGNGNHGTLKSIDPPKAWGTGRRGGALVLDGAGWVSTNRSDSYDAIVGEATIAFWIYKTVRQTGSRMVLHRQQNTGMFDRIWLGFSEDRPFWQFEGARVTGPSAVPLDGWVHVAGTYDGRTARLYVNGVEIGNMVEQRTLSLDPNGFTIGAERNSTNLDRAEAHVVGRLDDLLLYRRALSAAGIKALADGASP